MLLNPELAAQPDQGGNLPLHYAASSGVSTAAAVACALAFLDGLEWANKTGRNPLEIARLEGHSGLADVLSGMLNRRHNELHACFGSGPTQEAEQLRLLGPITRLESLNVWAVSVKVATFDLGIALGSIRIKSAPLDILGADKIDFCPSPKHRARIT